MVVVDCMNGNSTITLTIRGYWVIYPSVISIKSLQKTAEIYKILNVSHNFRNHIKSVNGDM